MPFGLTNTLATFQDMMNDVFSEMIDISLLVNMEDILVYTKTKEEHDWVKEVL